MKMALCHPTDWVSVKIAEKADTLYVRQTESVKEPAYECEGKFLKRKY